jgi:NAD(P)-dependent dehydrogenase (short-subunit alcohol dehydrogenase family)
MNFLNNLFTLKNKIAVVTGAANGNGKSISEALLRSGAKVILVDIDEKALLRKKNKLNRLNLKPLIFPCDITNSEKLLELNDFVLHNFKKIDILINNAGVTYGHEVSDYPEKLWDKTYETNLKAPFFLTKLFSKTMKRQKSGVIINITSINAELAFPNNPAYVAFKGGLKQLTKSLALDLGKYGIRVNNVGPGYIRTNMTKKSWLNKSRRKKIENKTILGRWGVPEDLTGLIILLSSDSSSYITGQDFYVDGGWLSKGL